MARVSFSNSNYRVSSPNVEYTESEIISRYTYSEVRVEGELLKPFTENLVFTTDRRVPKTGLLLVGLGGNNGTTVTAGILANKLGLTWHTREGVRKADYFGSLCRASTVRLGCSRDGSPVYAPFYNLVPMLDPNDLEIGGWDISSMNLGDAMRRAAVFEWDLQQQLYDTMQQITPWPSVYIPDFLAANQEDRADNILTGTKKEILEAIRANIRHFKQEKNLEKVIVLWTASTERFVNYDKNLHSTADSLLAAVENNESEISPSILFAMASILEGASYINGSPQNTLVPAVVELAERHGVMLAGDDFKSGQTKLKSVLADFLVSSGLKLCSVVSYNHLGNNDGKNLSAPHTFKTKETSKASVIEDIVSSNGLLYKPGEKPDHCVVIKYVPYVGDSKRAMDEYISEIFLGGKHTLIMHNTCEDSLLAAPLILDLVILSEFFERVKVRKESEQELETFHPVLSVLSFLLKAPQVPPRTPVVNALFPQRQCIVNIIRALVGLPPENNMLLEHKVPAMMTPDL